MAFADWAQHGIVGRGVLLDLVRFYTADGTKPLPYDPWTSHPIPLADIEACAAQQGVTFRTGDILILRVGFTQKWWTVTRAEREALSAKPETLCVRCLSIFNVSSMRWQCRNRAV